MQSLNHINVVITDWSGVISDDRKVVYEADMRVLEAHGKKRVGFGEWLSNSTPTEVELFFNYGVLGDPAALHQEYSSALARIKKEGMHPLAYPDAKKVMQNLMSRGKRLVVISSHPGDHLLEEAAAYKVKEYVAKFVGDVRDKAREIQQLRLEENTELSKMVYIGDTIYDIQAANKAGVHSVGITTGYHMRERLLGGSPEFIVDSLTEFDRLLP